MSLSQSKPVSLRLMGLLSILAAVALIASAGRAQAAVYSSGLDRDSRILVSAYSGVNATAVAGDTLYLGGGIERLSYRAPGLAIFDGSGELQADFAELDPVDSSTPATASAAVPDGDGGAYVLGVQGPGADGVRQPGLLHILADGNVDPDFRPKLETAAGGASADIRALVVGPDGVLYVGGGFGRVESEARPGLAALDAESGAVLDWVPELTGVASGPPAVEHLALAGDQILAAGAFTKVGDADRDGLAGLALDDAAPTEWAPPGLDASDWQSGPTGLEVNPAASGFLVHEGVAYLLARKAIRSVTTDGPGVVTDLGFTVADAGQRIAAGVIAGDSLYVTGNFLSLGTTERRGLAEIALPAGTLTSWDPGVPGAAFGTAIAADSENVYVSVPGDIAGDPWAGAIRCGAGAVRRSDGALTPWQPRIEPCNAPTALAVSGGKVWAAGEFVGANSEARNGLAAIDLGAGEILPWAPELPVNSTVFDLELSPDGSSIYTVGEFAAANGQPRTNAAAFDAAPGQPANGPAALRPWDPAISPVPYSLELAPTPAGDAVEKVFVSGFITEVRGSEDHRHLVAVDPTAGLPISSWKPNPDSSVYELALAPDGTLYAGGQFTGAGSTPEARNGLAAFAAGSDNPSSWNPQLAPGGTIYDLELDGDVLYAAGNFSGAIGGAERTGVAALSTDDGMALDWDAEADGPVGTVSVLENGDVYLIGGGIFMESSFTALAGSPRNTLGALTADGALIGWAPDVGNDFAGGEYRPFGEVAEVAGKLVVPGRSIGPVDGLPLAGLLTFGQPVAPATVYPPGLAGMAREGRTLTCEPGVYGRETYTRTYFWKRDGVTIAGATGTTYLVAAADRGHEITCAEKVANVLGEAEASSAPRLVAVNPPASEEAPEVFGTVAVGAQAGCTQGFWSDFPTGYEYTWLLDGTPIAGAQASTYVPIEGQQGHQLSCRVTAFNAAGPSASPATSSSRTIAARSPGGGGDGGGGNGGGGGGGGGGGASTPPPSPAPGPAPKPRAKSLKCKQGMVKKKVRGKAKCVKKKKPGAGRKGK